MNFHDLGLGAETLRAIDELGYTTPTPIQEKAIPYVQMGRDVIGVAQTGTGKTASFTLPMIDILAGGRAKARMPRSLILSPTRELATQIAENFDQFTKYQPLNKVLLIGGERMDEQIRILDRGADVLIATPGRLLDLFERGRILLNDIKIFVIDEADRMLDMGFIPDIEKIGSLLPPMRQTLLFSATMEPAIKRLAEKFLSNPKEVAVSAPASTNLSITAHLVMTKDIEKRQVLRHLLKQDNVTNAMIFCNRKKDIDVLVKSLQRHGFIAAGLHGDMAQSSRTETLDKFRTNEIQILVCSDVAARGLDIKGVSHVFNFDVPFNAEDYVHRIGRTGRAGQTGIAYTLATPRDEELLDNISKLTGKPIAPLVLEGYTAVPPREGARPDRSGKPSSERGGRSRGGKDRKPRSDKPKSDAPQAEKPAVPSAPRAPRAANNDRPRDSRSAVHDYEKGRRVHVDKADDGPVHPGFGEDMPAFFGSGSRR